MVWLAVMAWTGDLRVAKFAEFPGQDQAQAHIEAHASRFPAAFISLEPDAPFSHWRVDPVAETLSIDPPPDIIVLPEDTNTTADDVARALISKGTLTAADITNAKKTRP